MAAVQLAKEQKLELDAPISKYLPRLSGRWSSVTERQLLQHTAGIPQAFEATWLEEWEKEDAKDLLSVLAALNDKFPPLDFTPGSSWKYSNMGYILAGCVIEAASGMPYTEYVQKMVFTPFGMPDALFDHQVDFPHKVYSGNAVIPRLADGYNGPDDTLETARSKEYIETPAGGVIATVRDLDRYASAYLLKRDHDADIHAMEEHPYQVNERYSYGLGWEMITLDSHSVIFHSGGTNGYASVLMLVPANGLSLVAASNYGNDDVEGYAKALLHAIFDAAPASDHSMR